MNYLLLGGSTTCRRESLEPSAGVGSGCGVVAVSACMSGTRGSGVLSSTGDVLVRGVGGVCDMCMCLARGGVGGEGGEWMRELGLGFTNPLGTGGVLDMCLCFGCGGVGGGEWVGAWTGVGSGGVVLWLCEV